MTQAINITESGRRAYFAGLKPSDNPFKIGSAARGLWSKGYKQARTDFNSDDGDAVGAMMGRNE